MTAREPFTRTTARVLFTVPDGNPDVGAVEHDEVVELRHGDRFRAEHEAVKAHIPADRDAYQNSHLTVIVWCALVRTGLYREEFATFRDRDLVDLRVEKGDQDDVVGPTAAENTPSA